MSAGSELSTREFGTYSLAGSWNDVEHHPHRGATYRIFERDEGFAVEVNIPDMQPATVSSFPSRAAAKQWVDRHKEAIAQGDPRKPKPSFRQRQKMAGDTEPPA